MKKERRDRKRMKGRHERRGRQERGGEEGRGKKRKEKKGQNELHTKCNTNIHVHMCGHPTISMQRYIYICIYLKLLYDHITQNSRE